MIAPTGVYQERVWRSIVRSGAGKIYLLYDGKPQYEITEKVAKELASRAEKSLLAEVLVRKADFSDIEDVYRILVSIIEKERAGDPFIEIVFDTTSTTKEAWRAVSNLANAYGYAVFYVPGSKTNSAERVNELYQLEKSDGGGEVEIFTPTLCIPVGNPVTACENKVMCKLLSKAYNSVSELIAKIAEEEGRSQSDSTYDAFEKKYLRVVRDLEEKRLILGERGEGRTKSIQLTKEGRGIAKGLVEAQKN